MTNYYPTKKMALKIAADWRKRGYNARVLPKIGGARPYGVSVRTKKGKKTSIGYNPM